MKIAVLAGDGIGPEVIAEAVKVLRAAVGDALPLELIEAPIGGVALQAHGDPLPAHTLQLAREADAILFGSAGVPDDEKLPYEKRPGASLLRLRKDLDLFAYFRPAFSTRNAVHTAGPTPLYGWFARTDSPAARRLNISRSARSASNGCAGS